MLILANSDEIECLNGKEHVSTILDHFPQISNGNLQKIITSEIAPTVNSIQRPVFIISTY